MKIEETLAITPVSRTYRVLADGRAAVLRVDQPLAARLGLDRAAEPAVLRLVADAGLGPACLGADTASGTLLTEWLPGRAWSAAELREPGKLERAGRLLRELHGLPPPDAASGVPTLDLAMAIETYAALGGPRAAERARLAREALARCPVPHRGLLCLCHNDPTPGNFIEGADGRLRLIDWEYSAVGDPAFDLAGLAAGAGLDRSGDEILLRAYRGSPPREEALERLQAWKIFCRALARLWALALIE